MISNLAYSILKMSEANQNGENESKMKSQASSTTKSGKKKHRHKFMQGSVLHKGWLRKRPRISGYWRRRYFVLTEYKQGEFDVNREKSYDITLIIILFAIKAYHTHIYVYICICICILMLYYYRY